MVSAWEGAGGGAQIAYPQPGGRRDQGVGFAKLSHPSGRDGRAPQPTPRPEGTGQREAALFGGVAGAKRAQKPGRDWPGFFASPTDRYVMPPEGGRLRCERPLSLQTEGCYSRQGGMPFGAAFPHSAWSRKTPKIPERAARRDFPALRGHAPRRTKPRGILPPCAGTRPSPSGQGLCLRGSSLSWG